jgi:hypothetical protein
MVQASPMLTRNPAKIRVNLLRLTHVARQQDFNIQAVRVKRHLPGPGSPSGSRARAGHSSARMGDCKKASESCSSAKPTGSSTNTAQTRPTRYRPRSGQVPNTTELFKIPLPTGSSQFLILAPAPPFIDSECNRTEDASARGHVGAQHRATHVMPPNVPPKRIGCRRLVAVGHAPTNV